MAAQRRYSHSVDRSTGVVFDQTLVLQGYQSAKDYPESFRGIRYKDPETGKRLLFITNPTDSEPEPVRENPAGYSTYARASAVRSGPKRQPADSLQLTLGQA